MAKYAKVVPGNDWPFWYGERPLVGFLAAGIWASRGVCMEEFLADKKPRGVERLGKTELGRADLYFRHAKGQGNIEFKMHNIGISGSRHFADFLNRKWVEGKLDARRGQPGVRRFGGMFLRPYIGSHRDIGRYDENLRQLLRLAWATVKPDALAWWCPTKRVLQGHRDTKDWVVGAILLIKRVND
jgi:hypothetical protein